MHAGVTVVCDGTLPGELVKVVQFQPRRGRYLAHRFALEEPAAARVMPACPVFGECGGCQLQHARYAEQLAYKESLLRQALIDYGNVEPAIWMPSLSGDPFQYRRRVRLRVRQLRNGEIIIGFHRKAHSYLLDISECPVLEPRMQKLLVPLHRLVKELSVRARLPQIELCSGDSTVAVVVRHLCDLSGADQEHLREFARQQQVQIYTQAAGPDSIKPLAGMPSATLEYALPGQRIRLQYAANDFIQANARVNAMLVQRVLDVLAPTARDQILDLYAGIGNFSLPLARYAGAVTGVEFHPGLVARARDNATRNDLGNLRFLQADLDQWQLHGHYNKVLIDPPREGAMHMVKQVATLAPDTIVYVSCQPRTLGRDARYLVHAAGYRLCRAGLVDMFPQTRHIEAIAVFAK